MTPREHLAMLVAYRDDLDTALKEAAARIRLADDDTYWRYVQEYVFAEAMYVVDAAQNENAPHEDSDDILTDDPELMSRVDALITGS